MRRKFLTFLSVASVFVAVFPVCDYFFFQNHSFSFLVLAILNFIGWGSVGVLYLSERNLLSFVDSTGKKLGFSSSSGNLEVRLSKFLFELERFASASFDFRSDGIKSSHNLWANLCRIVTTTKRELNATSVELSLFDDKSKLWSQAILVGCPKTQFSQSMLVEKWQITEASDFRSDGILILAQPLIFAGTLFGCLRVELKPNAIPSKEDRRILSLFATQGSLMLIDAQFTNQLIRMKVAGDESIRAKTGFLANLSHEIRGPLGIILNGVELIEDGLCGEITKAQRDTLKMIKQNGDHLLDLVNDVLDYAKVEAGKVKAKPLDLPLKVLLKDLSNVVRSQSIQKKQKLHLEPCSDNLAVICDKRHARQMLINLLTNAVKYTEEGGSITISAEKLADNRAKITVADTGIGIPLSEQSKVFGAFERVENKYANLQVGTGLGMPLTKKLSEVNKGTVGFESEEGVGSTFWLILPATKIDKKIEEEEDSLKDAPKVIKGKGETILLVDKDTPEREMLSKYLGSQNFNIITALSEDSVIKATKENKIDLAIIECELPNISGEEMVSMLRENKASMNLPIIMLSSRAFVFDIEHFLKLGVDMCLSKPVNLSEIASTTRMLIDKTKG